MRHSIFLMNPIGSVEKTWGRFLNEAYLRCTYLQGRMHVLAGAVARTCKDGCTYLQRQMLNEGFSRKRLRERFITFASAVYNVCIRGCKRYPWRTHVFAFKVDQIGPGGCSALQGRMQCTAGAVAVHCV